MRPPFRRCVAVSILVALSMIRPVASAAQEAEKAPGTTAAQPKPLKDLVRLVEAGLANETWSPTIQPGLATPFQLRVLEAPPEPQRKAALAVTTFSTQPPGGASVAARIGLAGAATGVGRLPVTLDAPGWIDLDLLLENPRPGSTYKGRLALSAGSLYHTWEVTLVVPAAVQRSFSAESIPPVKLVTGGPCQWPIVAHLPNCDPARDHLSFTLTNRSDAPFSHVRVRFEPPGSAATRGTTSNFSIDSLSFWRQQQRLDLESRGSTADVQIPAHDQVTIATRVGRLVPGEYSGTLRFGAAEIADEAQEPRLPLVIQVRHHWLLPVVVIVLGSVLGWLGSKYAVGARKTRALRRQVNDLEARAKDFARSHVLNRTWHCPSEATSYSLARVCVLLRQLSDLISSVHVMLFREEELTDRYRDAERRIAALESVRMMRLAIESRAWCRPAVQMAMRELLISMHQILEAASFGDAQRAELDKLLQIAATWASDDTFVQRYREAVLNRLQREDQIPGAAEIASARSEFVPTLRMFFAKLPTEQQVREAPVQTLEEFDRTAGVLNLLWRERAMPWADALFLEASKGVPLDDLFRLVDGKAWDHVESHSDALTLNRPDTSQLEAYEVTTLRLTSGVPNVDDRRLQYHPLHVAWSMVMQPAGRDRRSRFSSLRDFFRRADASRGNQAGQPEVTLVTPDLRLMQSFPTPGRVEVRAGLRWEARREIRVDGTIALEILPTRRYELAFGWAEWAVLALGIVFAAATGIGALYDATFGSFGQYLTLLTWAAGAGTGANLFKELGTTMTAGGRSEAALPARAGATP